MDYQTASSTLLPQPQPQPQPQASPSAKPTTTSTPNQGPMYTLFGPLDASKYCWLFYLLSVVGFVLLALVLIGAVVGLAMVLRSGKSAKTKQGAWVVFGGVMMVSVQYAYLYFTNRLLYTMCSTSSHPKKGSGSAGVEGATFAQRFANASNNIGTEVKMINLTQAEDEAKRKAAEEARRKADMKMPPIGSYQSTPPKR